MSSNETSVNGDSVQYQQSNTALSTDLGEEGVITMDTDLARYFGMRETASAIWNLFENATTIDDAVAVLERDYEAEPNLIRSEVRAFTSRLVERGLLEKVSAD